MSIYIGNNNKIKNSIIGDNQNILSLIQKGDIITYDCGRVNFVNKPFKYQMYFETNPFSIEMIPTIDITEAGWYEEDKAKKYCEDLNNNKLYKENDIKFILEEVVK